jgi:hypothetical protein
MVAAIACGMDRKTAATIERELRRALGGQRVNIAKSAPRAVAKSLTLRFHAIGWHVSTNRQRGIV